VGVVNLSEQVAKYGTGNGGAIQVSLAPRSGIVRAQKKVAVLEAPKKIVKTKSTFAVVQKPQAAVEASSAAVAGDLPSVATGTGPGGSATGIVGGTLLNGKGTKDPRTIYKAELRSRIDKNKFYPLMSRRLGQTGVVVVAFTLLEDGTITDVRVESPSSHEPLNDSALEAVKKVGRFKPIPKEFQQAKIDMSIPVNFLTI
jgi:TonB family protein